MRECHRCQFWDFCDEYFMGCEKDIASGGSQANEVRRAANAGGSSSQA